MLLFYSKENFINSSIYGSSSFARFGEEMRKTSSRGPFSDSAYGILMSCPDSRKEEAIREGNDDGFRCTERAD